MYRSIKVSEVKAVGLELQTQLQSDAWHGKQTKTKKKQRESHVERDWENLIEHFGE